MLAPCERCVKNGEPKQQELQSLQSLQSLQQSLQSSQQSDGQHDDDDGQHDDDDGQQPPLVVPAPRAVKLISNVKVNNPLISRFIIKDSFYAFKNYVIKKCEYKKKRC